MTTLATIRRAAPALAVIVPALLSQARGILVHPITPIHGLPCNPGAGAAIRIGTCAIYLT